MLSLNKCSVSWRSQSVCGNLAKDAGRRPGMILLEGILTSAEVLEVGAGVCQDEVCAGGQQPVESGKTHGAQRSAGRAKYRVAQGGVALPILPSAGQRGGTACAGAGSAAASHHTLCKRRRVWGCLFGGGGGRGVAPTSILHREPAYRVCDMFTCYAQPSLPPLCTFKCSKTDPRVRFLEGKILKLPEEWNVRCRSGCSPKSMDQEMSLCT